jgi:wyosine [tRNA(Phe)-imidazoG37] synthetase (radical SAM superfamily)
MRNKHKKGLGDSIMKECKLVNIVIENTTLCAASCVMCPREKFKHPHESMKFTIFKKSIDESVKAGVKYMCITGYGEPLMDSELEEKLKYIKDNYDNVKVGINTTGHRLRGSILDVVCKYVDIIRISNYGITKESYERVHRGLLKYEDIKKNIEMLLERCPPPPKKIKKNTIRVIQRYI